MDWWQLPPVKATPCTVNPLKCGSSGAQKMLNMFWTKESDSYTGLIELTEEMRCADPWLSALLKESRAGRQQLEMYYFFHGLPTENPASWMPWAEKPTCENSGFMHGTGAAI